MRRFLLPLCLLLAACNLQQQPPAAITPSPAPPDEQISTSLPPQTQPTAVLPTIQPGLQPTLQPTPTQITLVTVTLPPQPTTVEFSNLEGLPTLDPALADEQYELQVRDGATVGVNYEVTLITGTVDMVLQGPDGVLWQKTFTSSETGRAEVQVEQGGTYQVLVDRNRFDGNYSVSWD